MIEYMSWAMLTPTLLTPTESGSVHDSFRTNTWRSAREGLPDYGYQGYNKDLGVTGPTNEQHIHDPEGHKIRSKNGGDATQEKVNKGLIPSSEWSTRVSLGFDKKTDSHPTPSQALACTMPRLWQGVRRQRLAVAPQRQPGVVLTSEYLCFEERMTSPG